MRDVVLLIARILVALIFLMAGINKVLDPAGTQMYMAAHGMPLTGLFLAAAIIFELLGGLSVLLGFRARWGAVALAVFLVPATLIFHTQFSDQGQVIHFMKNLAILGGLLMVASCGSGKLSLDPAARSCDIR
jgi:putative oxidoreductase